MTQENQQQHPGAGGRRGSFSKEGGEKKPKEGKAPGKAVKAPKAVNTAKNKTMPDRNLLEDLSSRFVVNASAEELKSFERILFLIEQAHWFYEDNLREGDTVLKSLSLREFTETMFQQCRSLKPYQKFVHDIYDLFTEYKHTIPVNGAIILNPSMDKVLLVRGYKAGASWGFPKGKMNKDEPDWICAVREVEEEIGFNIQHHVIENSLFAVDAEPDSLCVHRGQQRTRLFIIPGVSEMTPLAPQTKKEIGDINWHYVSSLPTHSKSNTDYKFFLVHAFVNQLKSWIKSHKAQYPPELFTQQEHQQQYQHHPIIHANPLAPPPAAPHPHTPPLQPPVSPFLTFKFDTQSIMAAWDQHVPPAH